VFPDVLLMTSVAGQTAHVGFTFAGLPDGAAQAGFWDEKRGLVDSALTLNAGDMARIAVSFELPGASPSGVLEGSLDVTATAGAGVSQHVTVPLFLIVTPMSADPAGSPSPESSPAKSPAAAVARARAGGWRWRPMVQRLGLLF
jgi:hypothetical protein